MNLLIIRDYLKQVKIATLQHLCIQFKTEPETIRCLLRHWLKKGKVRQCGKKSACGKICFSCPPLQVELYEWVGV